MASNSAAQLAAEVAAIFDADRNQIIRQAKRAIFTSTTNSSYIDYLGFPAGVTLTIRAIRQQRRCRLPGGTER
jgi:hypothetical protein